MVWISKKQKTAMAIVNGIVNEFGKDRWFVQSELPGITLHSINALVDKGYLEQKISKYTEMPYYRRMKVLED